MDMDFSYIQENVYCLSNIFGISPLMPHTQIPLQEYTNQLSIDLHLKF